MIIYVVFVCEERLIVHFIMTFFTFHFFFFFLVLEMKVYITLPFLHYFIMIISLFINQDYPFNFYLVVAMMTFLLIRTAILKIRMKSFYDFLNLNHLLQ